MGNFEARLEREWERADEHAAGRHDKPFSDCAACQKREAAAAQRPNRSWTVDPDGYVRAPLENRGELDNREGDPSLNGALDKW